MTLPAEASRVPSDDGVVTFGPRVRGRVLAALPSTALVVCLVVLGLTEPTSWLAWVLLVTQLPMAVIRWLAVRAARRQPWALRVDADGVRWRPDGPLARWSRIAGIEVHRAEGWRRLLPHRDQVLLVTHAAADFARRAGTRPTGYAIRLDEVRASAEEVVAACRPFTDAPAGLRLR